MSFFHLTPILLLFMAGVEGLVFKDVVPLAHLNGACYAPIKRNLTAVSPGELCPLEVGAGGRLGPRPAPRENLQTKSCEAEMADMEKLKNEIQKLKEQLADQNAWPCADNGGQLHQQQWTMERGGGLHGMVEIGANDLPIDGMPMNNIDDDKIGPNIESDGHKSPSPPSKTWPSKNIQQNETIQATLATTSAPIGDGTTTISFNPPLESQVRNPPQTPPPAINAGSFNSVAANKMHTPPVHTTIVPQLSLSSQRQQQLMQPTFAPNDVLWMENKCVLGLLASVGLNIVLSILVAYLVIDHLCRNRNHRPAIIRRQNRGRQQQRAIIHPHLHPSPPTSPAPLRIVSRVDMHELSPEWRNAAPRPQTIYYDAQSNNISTDTEF